MCLQSSIAPELSTGGRKAPANYAEAFFIANRSTNLTCDAYNNRNAVNLQTLWI
jgi:hypothetical protein